MSPQATPTPLNLTSLEYSLEPYVVTLAASPKNIETVFLGVFSQKVPEVAEDVVEGVNFGEPLTSNFAAGAVVPIPTFPVEGWTVSGELCAKRLDGSEKSSAAINVLWIRLMLLVNIVASSCCKVKLRTVLVLH